MSRLETPPDFLWRISKYEDRGGSRVSGRWHTRPKSIVYCAQEPHTAFLEVLRQFGDEMLLPDSLKVLKIRVPKHAHMISVEIDELDPLWSDAIHGYGICQPIGDAWLHSLRSPLLRIPSVTGPGRHTILLNPAHRDADDFLIEDVISQPFPASVRLDEDDA